MPDGFGSTHAAARKFVEETTSGGAQPVLAAVPQADAICRSLETLLARVSASGLKSAEARQFKSVTASAQKLFALLRGGQLQDPLVVSRLVELTQCTDRDDFVGAATHMGEMVRNSWKDHRDWLKSFKFLTTLCRMKFG